MLEFYRDLLDTILSCLSKLALYLLRTCTGTVTTGSRSQKALVFRVAKEDG